MAYTSLTQPLILVTGASGNVGREVLKSLKPHTKEGSVRVRVGTRSDHGLDEGENVERVYFDFSERATYAAAVRGCQSLFLLRPPAVANTKETLNPLIDAAREAGVAQIVFLSVAGADKNRVVPHHAVEAHLQAGPLDWTILRPGFFAQNIGTAYRADVTEEHRLYLPAGGARVAFVDLRDVGEVAADALVAGERHRGKGYTLTGPEAFSFEEVADFLTAAAGAARPLRTSKRPRLRAPSSASGREARAGRGADRYPREPALRRRANRRPHPEETFEPSATKRARLH